MAEIIRPKVREFVEERSENARKMAMGKKPPRRSKMPEVDGELCFEIENYVTMKLKWWITRDELDERKIDVRVREILGFMRRMVEEARRQD